MEHKYIAVHYQLYAVKDNERELIEQTSREKPFQFISGFGISLEGLEKHVLPLEKGTEFDFTLSQDEAFGEYVPEGVHKLSRDVFTVNGKFDAQNIFQGSIITLTDTEGNHFPAQVIKVEDDGVTVDTNHPFAGKMLNFTGEIMENRLATDDEVNALIQQMAGGCKGCGGHCEDSGSCNNCECEEGGCENGRCGHCH